MNCKNSMTHYAGCDCHEGRRNAEIERLRKKLRIEETAVMWHLQHISGLEATVARYRDAMKFYANQEHFSGLESWDTVSGEPQNYIMPEDGCHECQQAVVEDGATAREALKEKP